MPLGRLTPTSASGKLADHERKLRRRVVAPQTVQVPFSQFGALTPATSPPWAPPTALTLREVRVLLGTAGSSDTVITAAVNGSTVATVTLGSGDTNAAESVTVPMAQDTDLLTMTVTTAGTGAADLTVIAKLG